jgi:hypothetical protein
MLWQEWSKQGLNAMGKLVADTIVEGEFPLVRALLCLTEARRAPAA